MSQNSSVTNALSGLVPNNFPTNQRAIIDNNFVVTVAMPAAAALANTNALDLGDMVSGVPYVTTETINVGVLTTASVNGNSNTATLILQHTSANTDGTPNAAAWANIPTLGTVAVLSGASSTNATNNTYKLPPATKRFIRAQANNPTGSVSLADSILTLELFFLTAFLRRTGETKHETNCHHCVLGSNRFCGIMPSF